MAKSCIFAATTLPLSLIKQNVMREINRIIIHCAATKGDVSVATVRKWHLERSWADIGYHYLIRTNGDVQVGRPVGQVGAHTHRHNHDSIGICLAGGFSGQPDYTDAQWHSLAMTVMGLDAMYAIKEVRGHNDYTSAKTCPNFDVGAWWLKVRWPRPERSGPLVWTV